MTQSSTNAERETVNPADLDVGLAAEVDEKAARERTVARLRRLWDQRRFLFRVSAVGLVVFTVLAFLIPKRYESTTRLMPPDTQSGSGLGMLAALTGMTGKAGGLGFLASDLLGMKTSSALFVGILRSRTVEDRLVDRFDLKKVYGVRRWESARKMLASNTEITDDRKNGIIKVTVTDKSPQRAAAMAQAYVEELDHLVAKLTTSAAHRERVFLEGRLKAVKQDLDSAAKEFSQFASKNVAIDIPTQGRAMVEAAAVLQGRLIAAQTELEGLKQIYTENNVRVRAAQARIAEFRRQLEKLGGKDMPAGGGSSPQEESFYPSIRRLPLLGVTYADLYRRTKIQEVVYELLTQQYELAKVQEAKEIPSVKVLDPADIPERKSFPPRLLIMFLGTFLSVAFGALWVLARARWAETDPQDPAKLFAQEVFMTLKTQNLWPSENGFRLGAMARRLSSLLSRRKTQPQDDEHR